MSATATDRPAGDVVLGTAGHIDHGKTALVRSLTGQETDRLREERERGISIDLGFAYYDEGGRRIGVVDVPGHERFIRNMLAGAHGIDVVLLVVAADDGIMPQTEEHLDIVHLLGVRRGIFVVTKTDLVPQARVAEVRGDIEVLASGTAFEGAPVVEVSNATGAGLDELRREIGRQVALLPPREDRGPFRMPIDRAFAMRGHGLVVTGTVLSGALHEGDPVAIRPDGPSARARTIQRHGERVAAGHAGQRLAVNLAGLDREEATRGQVLVDPRLEFTTDRFDCWLEARGGARRPLRSFDRVRVHAGTAEVMGRATLLGGPREIAAGEAAFCQIALDEPVLLAHGDRFIVRSETATRTSGGGTVLHPFATWHLRGGADAIAHLAVLRDGALEARLGAFLEAIPEFAAPTSFLVQGLARETAAIHAAARANPAIVALPSESEPEAYTTSAKWSRLGAEVVQALREFHEVHPLERGMELESVRSRLRVALPPRLFRPVVERMERAGLVRREDALLRLPAHRVRMEGGQADLAAQVEQAIARGGLTPPDLKQLEEALGVAAPQLLQVLGVLVRDRRLVRVAPDLHYAPEAFERARAALLEWLREQPQITAAEYRSLLSASRKYAIALLDHFDQVALTIRVGDARRLRRPGAA